MADVPDDFNGRFVRYRVEQLEHRLAAVEDRFGRMIMSVVVASFTLAGAMILLAINLLVVRRG